MKCEDFYPPARPIKVKYQPIVLTMILPSADTPLYNHPLPTIEAWLRNLGCEKDDSMPHCWHIQFPQWTADLCLEVEEMTVHYNSKDSNQDIARSFKYSLSREDIEAAVLAGP